MDMRSMSLAWRPSNFLACSPSLSPKFYVPHSFIGEPFSGIDSATLTSRAIRPVNLVARLKPEVTVETASYEMAQIGRDLAEEHPDTNKDSKAVVLTQLAYRQTANPAARALPILLFTVVALVLGIACVNVSNLLLSTVPSRNREMAVRVAMARRDFGSFASSCARVPSHPPPELLWVCGLLRGVHRLFLQFVSGRTCHYDLMFK
jgi:hypothetical protein